MFECFYEVFKGKLNTYEIEKWLPVSNSWLSRRPKSCIQELFSLIFDNFSQTSYWFRFHFFLQKLHPKKTPKMDSLDICFLIVITEAWESHFPKNGDGFLFHIKNRTPISASPEAWVHLSNSPIKSFHLRNRIELQNFRFPSCIRFLKIHNFLKLLLVGIKRDDWSNFSPWLHILSFSSMSRSKRLDL